MHSTFQVDQQPRSMQLRDRRQMPQPLHASNASYVSWTGPDRFSVREQIGDRDEAAPIGPHRVRRGFAGLQVVQELLEPLGDLIDDRQHGGSFNGVFGDARIGLVRHTASQAAYRDINVTVTN